MSTKSKPKQDERIVMSFRTSPEIRQRFHEHAARQARTASQQIRWLIERDLALAEKEAA